MSARMPPRLLILVPLMAGALMAQRPWQRIAVPPVGEVAANFKTPPREYGAIHGATREKGSEQYGGDRQQRAFHFLASRQLKRDAPNARCEPESKLTLRRVHAAARGRPGKTHECAAPEGPERRGPTVT